MSALPNNMKLLRESLKLSQEAMAKLFKTTRPNINAYEGGKVKKLPADLMERITVYFGITSQQLIKQKLTPEDLKITGKVESVIEVKLQAALHTIEILQRHLADKERIIKLQERVINGHKST